MTYGYWLDRATAALQTTQQAVTTDHPTGHGEAAVTFTARNQVYQRLAHLTACLTGQPTTSPSTRAADALVNNASRRAAATPERLLAVGLGAAAAGPAPPPMPSAPMGDVAEQLSTAADALGMAGDILASHRGAPGQAARTREGHTIAMRAGRHLACADLAELASMMIKIDRDLPTWLGRGPSPRTLQPLYRPVLEHLRWWTTSPYPPLLANLATSAHGQSPLRLLNPAPPTERSNGPRPVTSLREIGNALDTTRAWLQQHPEQAQLADLAAASRVAGTITTAAVRLDPSEPVTAYARSWGRIAKALPRLTGLTDTPASPYQQELKTARDWLRDRLADDTTKTATPGWQAGVPKLLDRLPPLADQLQHAVTTAAARGHLYIRHVGLDMSKPVGGIFRVRTTWQQVRPSDRELLTVQQRLREAANLPTSGGTLLKPLINPVTLARHWLRPDPHPGDLQRRRHRPAGALPVRRPGSRD